MGDSKIFSNIAGDVRKSIENIKATADRTNKKIILTWKEEESDLERILVYRSEGDNNVALYKSITAKDKQFIDEKVTINTEYSYYLKVVFKNGEESGFGEKLTVKF